MYLLSLLFVIWKQIKLTCNMEEVGLQRAWYVGLSFIVSSPVLFFIYCVVCKSGMWIVCQTCWHSCYLCWVLIGDGFIVLHSLFVWIKDKKVSWPDIVIYTRNLTLIGTKYCRRILYNEDDNPSIGTYQYNIQTIKYTKYIYIYGAKMALEDCNGRMNGQDSDDPT